jgi:hypothetical protein
MKIPVELRSKEQNKYMKGVVSVFGSATQMKAIRDFVKDGTLEDAEKINVFDKLAAARKNIVEGEYREVTDGLSTLRRENGLDTEA